jgi:hypothetical protein
MLLATPATATAELSLAHSAALKVAFYNNASKGVHTLSSRLVFAKRRYAVQGK